MAGPTSTLTYRCEEMIHKSRNAQIAIISALAALLLSACVLSRGSAPITTTAGATPIPTFTPAPRPTLTPTPLTSLSQAQAEQLVWTKIRSCAEQISSSTQSAVQAVFVSTFSTDENAWSVEASSIVLGLDFGSWKVEDSTNKVSPVDVTAVDIASSNYVCGQPGALLADRGTPPLFIGMTATPPPVPSSTPTPISLVARNEAETLVIQQVSSCAEQLVGMSQLQVELAFDSFYSAEEGGWVVEASSPSLGVALGTWKVSESLRLVTPLDDVAIDMSDPDITCSRPTISVISGLSPPRFSVLKPEPDVKTGDGARRVVWLAVYNCYDSPPRYEDFAAYEDRADGWIVEGRSEISAGDNRPETITVGLWSVDAQTGKVTPNDQTAQNVAASQCFNAP